MTSLGHVLNTDAGRDAFSVYAADSVRIRIRKRWERRRKETGTPTYIRTMGSSGHLIPVTDPTQKRWVEVAIEGDGADPETIPFTALMDDEQMARRRHITTHAHRERMILT